MTTNMVENFMLVYLKSILAKYPRIKNFLRWLYNGSIVRRIRLFSHRLGLRNRDFSIISCNCSGGYIYQYFGLPYQTPTAGLYFSNDDYLKLIQNPRYYFAQELQFIDSAELENPLTFPVAKLGDVRVYFMHYKTENEAREKWTRRVQRINYDRLVFLLTESIPMNPKHIVAFDQVNTPNKIFLTIHDYPDCLSAVKVIDTFSQEDHIVWPAKQIVAALPWKRFLNQMVKKK